MLKTQTIAGTSITLEEGRRYLATRPINDGSRQYDVTISDDDGPYLVLPDMSYDEANNFLVEFNNGRTSFEGRVW